MTPEQQATLDAVAERARRRLLLADMAALAAEDAAINRGDGLSNYGTRGRQQDEAREPVEEVCHIGNCNACAVMGQCLAQTVASKLTLCETGYQGHRGRGKARKDKPVPLVSMALVPMKPAYGEATAKVLAFLAEHGASTTAEICQGTHVCYRTVHRAIARQQTAEKVISLGKRPGKGSPQVWALREDTCTT